MGDFFDIPPVSFSGMAQKLYWKFVFLGCFGKISHFQTELIPNTLDQHNLL